MKRRTLASGIHIDHVQTPEERSRWEEPFTEAYVSIFAGEPYFEDISEKQAKRVYERLNAMPDSITLIAYTGDKNVVGFAMAVPLACMRPVAQALTGLVPMKHTYYLAELGVRPEFRGKGLGRALVSLRLRLMDTSRYSHVVLRMSETRSSSSELYEALGFEDMGVSMEVTAKRTDGTERSDRRIFLHRVLSQVDIEE